MKRLFPLFLLLLSQSLAAHEFKFLRFDSANKIESEHQVDQVDIKIERKVFPSFMGKLVDVGEETNVAVSLRPGDKSLLGIYPRNAVSRPAQYPARTVGLLNGNCTATLIGPAHILTAAHCVFDRARQRFHDSFYFSAGQQLSFEPYGGVLGRVVYMPKDYAIKGGVEHDYALIILNHSIGLDIGWMGFAPMDKAESQMFLQGYPGDKDFASPWAVECPLKKQTDILGVHLCDTYSGMSGSSFYRFTDREKMHPLVQAIHIYGERSSNGARMINEQVFEQLAFWMKDSEDKLYDGFVNSRVISEPSHKVGHDLYFKNSCHETIRVAVKVKNAFGYSTTHHWKYLAAGERAFIASTQKKSYEFYADTPNGPYTWSGLMRGCQFLRGDTRVFCFIKREVSEVQKRYNEQFDIIEEVLDCNGRSANNDTFVI